MQYLEKMQLYSDSDAFIEICRLNEFSVIDFREWMEIDENAVFEKFESDASIIFLLKRIQRGKTFDDNFLSVLLDPQT